MLKRFGDTPMTRRAILQAHGKATAEGLTPETYEKHLAAEFAKWIGKEPDGEQAVIETLGKAAPTVQQTQEPDAGTLIPTAMPVPTAYPAPTATPSPAPAPSPTPSPTPAPAPTATPFPNTTAALTAALTAFSFSSSPGNQANSQPWGAGRPHFPTWPTQPGTSTTPGQTPTQADPGAGSSLADQPQAQENWRLVGQIIAEEIRKALDTVFKTQTQQATQQAANANPVASEPTGGVSLPRVLNRLAGKLPKPLQGMGRKAVRAFGKTRFGKAARRGVAALGKTKVGRGISKYLGSKITGGGGAAGGLGKGNVLLAIGQSVKETFHQMSTPQGSPNGGYVDRAASTMGLGSVIKFAKTLDNATERLVQWNIQMGSFSAAMSKVALEREVREIGRSREMGDRLAGSAQALANAEQNRKDAEVEYKTFKNYIENIIEGALNNIQANFLNMFSGAMKKVNEQIGAKGAEGKDDLGSILDRAVEADRKMTEDALAKMREIRQRNAGR